MNAIAWIRTDEVVSIYKLESMQDILYLDLILYRKGESALDVEFWKFR